MDAPTSSTYYRAANDVETTQDEQTRMSMSPYQQQFGQWEIVEQAGRPVVILKDSIRTSVQQSIGAVAIERR